MIRVTSLDEAAEVIAAAMADKKKLGVTAGNSKAALGRQSVYDDVIDASAMCGIIDYQPEELVLTLRAGTLMTEVEDVVASAGQMLPFEVPDLSALLGSGSTGTIGGVLSTNLSGSRRLTAGAARDYLLGFQAVSGRGEFFKSGGKVMKNVTGYDLSKLICGSYGTLAIVDNVTIKTLPRPETAISLLFGCNSMAAAVSMIASIFATAYEPNAAAILPAPAAHAATIEMDAAFVVVIRLEGIEVSVNDRAAHLAAVDLGSDEVHRLEAAASALLWQQIRDVTLLPTQERAIWRISVAPAQSPAILDQIGARFDIDYFADWAGGLVWLSASGDASFATALRGAIESYGGGYAQRIIDRRSGFDDVPPFHPLSPTHLALHQRVKAAFDPLAVLNYGRMHAGL